MLFLAALWNLAYRNNPNRKAIVLAGAIPLLVQLLRVRPVSCRWRHAAVPC
jgi:hypothetical protein